MSRLFYICIFCLSPLWLLTHARAEDEASGSANSGSESDFKQFVGVDLSAYSKEDLIPPLDWH